ncbi:MAG: site-specific integrase [Anaeroplasma bactoclasticum]|nr:site-specific integrase [Anaeroplasma bactoclasticum]
MPVYKDKERGTWFYEFKRVINGQSIKKKGRGFSSKIEAQKAEFEMLKSLENNSKNKTISDSLTLDELFDIYNNYRKTRIRITTLSGEVNKYNNHIHPTLGKSKLKSITAKNIINWKNDFVKKNYSQKFTNKVIRVFKKLLEFAQLRGTGLNENIFLELESVNMHQITVEREIWSYEEINKFLDTFILEIPQEKDYHDYFYAYSRSGMRPNEFRALQVKDIQGEHLNVNKDITSKITGQGDIIQPPKNQNSIRKIIMPKEIMDLLRERTKDYSPNDFIFGKEKAFRETSLIRCLNRHADAAGLKRIVLYGFRHSHATHLIRSGVPLKVVQQRLGHKDVSTTINTYWHLFKEDEKQALNVLK